MGDLRAVLGLRRVSHEIHEKEEESDSENFRDLSCLSWQKKVWRGTREVEGATGQDGSGWFG